MADHHDTIMPHKIFLKMAAQTIDWTVIIAGMSSLLVPVFGVKYTEIGAVLAGIGGLLIGWGRFTVFRANAKKIRIETVQMEEHVDKRNVARLEELACLNASVCETRRGIHHYNPEEDY